MQQQTFIDANPATGTKGTRITAGYQNNINSELSNVLIDLGVTPDASKSNQISQALEANYAKLNSPTLTGIPLTSNPDGKNANQIATVDYVNQKALQATVGFTPVQQSGGTEQGTNKVYLGADSSDSTQARIQIDESDLGKIVFQVEDTNTYGVSRIGYNHTVDKFAFYNTGDKEWRFSYTSDYIDEKNFITSIPDSGNFKIENFIWNTTSKLPELYYDSNSSAVYVATTDWSNKTFIKNGVPNGNLGITSAVIDYNTKGPSFLDGSNVWHQVQPYGDYATNISLNNEISRATTAENNLNISITNGLSTKQPIGNYITKDSDTSLSSLYISTAPAYGSNDGYIPNTYWVNQAIGTMANTLQQNINNETTARISADNDMNAVKANLNGGNNLTGTQAITDGNQYATVGVYTEVTGSTYDTNLIKGTAPNGTIYQITMREYAGSHYSMLHYIYDGTNFSIYEMPQTAYNGGRLLCPAGTGAVLSDLPTSGITAASGTAGTAGYIGPASWTITGSVMTISFVFYIGGSDITILFPKEFGGKPTCIILDETNNDLDIGSEYSSWSSTQFTTMAKWGSGNQYISVIATGPAP